MELVELEEHLLLQHIIPITIAAATMSRNPGITQLNMMALFSLQMLLSVEVAKEIS